MISVLPKLAASKSGDSVLPWLSFAICFEMTSPADFLSVLMASTAALCTLTSFVTRSGFALAKSFRTMTTAVANFPPGQSVRSSVMRVAPASLITRDTQGSGSHAASSSPRRKRSRASAGAYWTMSTSPPLSLPASPATFSACRREMSCVPPVCGTATRLPLRSLTDFIA